MCAFLLATAGVHGQTRHYLPLNGGFEDLNAAGEPVGWNLTSSPGTDDLPTFSLVTSTCFAGLHGLRIGSEGTGKAIATTRIPVEFADLRMLYLGTAHFYYKVLSSDSSGRNLRFRLILLNAGNDTVVSQKFSPPQDHVADGMWHVHNFNVDIRQSRTARYIVMEFSVNSNEVKGRGEWLIDEIRIFDMGPAVHIGRLTCSRSLLRTGEETNITLNVTNNGGAPVYNMVSSLDIKGSMSIKGSSYVQVPLVEPGKTYDISWTLMADGTGPCVVTATSSAPGNLSGGTQSSTLIFGVAEFSRPNERADTAVVKMTQQEAVLENPYIRIVFPHSQQGYGLFDVQCWNGSWRSMGVSIPIGYTIYLTDFNTTDLLLLTPTNVDSGGNSTTQWLSLTGQAFDRDGVTWKFGYTFSLSRDDPSVGISMTVATSDNRRLLRLNGPNILAGEGSFGLHRQEAIFGGLEYLLGKEKSSGTDFVKPPKNVRSVPNPLKITIPLMAIESDNATIALSWNPLQKWDGYNQLPSAEFWSPNRPSNQSNHLMCLFLPSVPKWVNENQEQAYIPYQLGNATLTLKMNIFAKADSTVIDSILWWLDKNGVPSPPSPPRSLHETLDLCTHCFKDICWVPSAKAWKHTYLNDPKWIFRDPLVALALWHYSAMTHNETLRSEIRTQVLEAYPPDKGGGDGIDLALHIGGVDRSLVATYTAVNALVDSQRADGSWPFTPDLKHEELGRPGDTSTGLVANKAAFLLKFGRISGDTEAISAGLKALHFLDTQRRPEGAQTWELQLHVPDVLASAYLVESYTEAYRITGNPKYLQKARYWALTGLPFIYLWNTADRPIMRYASIPVFGASWYTNPWFGIAVQWNGLVYAYQLYQLSTVDSSFPWRRISEGITDCGIRMQRYSGGPHAEVAGMYPDGYSVVNGRDAYYFDLNPRFIALCAFALAGEDENTQTTLIFTPNGTIHISGVGKIANGTLANGLLEFDNSYSDGDTSYVLVGGVSEPQSVAVDGRPLENTEDLSAVQEGWEYRDEGVLVIKLVHSLEDHIEVNGVHPRPSSRFSNASRWEFSSGKEGWMAANMLTNISIQSGKLSATSTGGDPYLIGPRVRIEASKSDRALIRMRITAGSWGQLFWTTRGSRYFTEKNSIKFPIKADGLFHLYVLDLGNLSEWTDTVTELRLDPTDSPDSDIDIDYIRIPEPILSSLGGLLASMIFLYGRRSTRKKARADITKSQKSTPCLER